MTYDPRKQGAKCDVCPLRGNTPIGPEANPGATICLVGEAPNVEDIREGMLFAGVLGQELQRGLNSSGLKRRDLHITSVLACQPPKNELTALLAKINSENRVRTRRNQAKKKAYEALLKKQKSAPEPEYESLIESPVDCCRPRLINEAARFRNFITLGGMAAKQIMNTNMSMLALRGGTAELDPANGLPARRVMPTLHPSFVQFAPRWSTVFRNDLHRANRWFKGGLKWSNPNVTYHPTAAQLVEFFSKPDVAYWTYDLETDGIESLTAKIRCIGIGTPNGEVMLVGFLGRDGHTRFYTQAEEQKVIQVLKAFFVDPTKLKVGHNSGSYDSNCLNANWGVWPTPAMDTILLHRLVASEHPHSLGFVGSMYTDAPTWKCYDGETEVLTPKGWVRFDALKRDELVAEWSSGIVRFVKPRAYVNQLYKGPIWKLGNQAVDLMVTPDHKMVFKPQKVKWLQACQVQDLPFYGSLPHAGTYAGGTAAPSEKEIQLLLFFASHGQRTIDEEGNENLIFTSSNLSVIEEIKSTLAQLELTWTESSTGPRGLRARIAVSVTKRVYHLEHHLRKELCSDFHFGPWLFEWNLTSRQFLIDELEKKLASTRANCRYYSMTEEDVDWIQACAVISDRSVRKGYEVLRDSGKRLFHATLPKGKKRTRQWSNLRNLQRETSDFDGRIYCVSVPSSFLLVRRNGKVVVSGNTDREGKKLAYDAESDEQLHLYCAMDVAVTSAILPPLFDSVRLRKQTELVQLDHKIQRICAEMHMVGMYVDQNKRLLFEKKYITEAGKRLEDLRAIAPTTDFNPGSSHQVADILFTRWNLVSPLEEKDRFTDSGDYATSDDVLRSLLSLSYLKEDQREFILRLRRYRKAQKLLGTYIVKLRPSTMQADLGWDEDEDFEDAEMREKYGLTRTGIVNPLTSRMHPGYNAHVAVTGRLSSSKPINAQNFTKALRSMVTAAPGHVLIGADADQLELRIAAALWQAQRYLRAFDAGADPHAATALACFGDRFKRAEGFPGGRWDGDLFIPDGTGKWQGEGKTFRDLAKKVQYASQYMATVETVHRVICQTEQMNDDGTSTLPYLHLTLARVREMHEAWLAGCPEFPQGWEREIAQWRKQTFLEEPVTHRRRDFLDGENPNELVNFKVQGAAAGLINKATINLCEFVSALKWGPGTGMINQCHDALTAEVPADGAVLHKKHNPETGKEEKVWVVPPGSIPAQVMERFDECLNQVHPALKGVKITAKADIGNNWMEVG